MKALGSLQHEQLQKAYTRQRQQQQLQEQELALWGSMQAGGGEDSLLPGLERLEEPPMGPPAGFHLCNPELEPAFVPPSQ